MTNKDYKLRELNEEFYKSFYIPKITCKEIIDFVNKGGDLNYDREGTLKNLIWNFEDKEYMPYTNILECMLENGLDVNAPTKDNWSDSQYRGEKKNLLKHVLDLFRGDFFNVQSSTYYKSEIVIEFVKILIKYKSKLPIYLKNQKPHLQFDIKNKNLILHALIKDNALDLPTNIVIVGEDYKTVNDEIDELFDGVFDDDVEDNEEKTDEDAYTFEDWALEYLPNYEKGMETYDGDIECFPKKIDEVQTSWAEHHGDENRWEFIYSKAITSLKGCPKYIKGDFNCSENRLESLKYAPKEVGGDFDCKNNSLKSLEHSPNIVKGNFICSKNMLTSLESITQDISGYIDCTENENLDSLDAVNKDNNSFIYHANTKIEQGDLSFKNWAIFYMAKHMGKDRLNDYLENYDDYINGNKVWERNLDCSAVYPTKILKITNLTGCPKIISGDFNCSDNKIKSLKYGPKKVSGKYNCKNNQLENLLGAPKIAYSEFNCYGNKLTSLEGAPVEVKKAKSYDGEFYYSKFACGDNNLESLKYIPKVDDEIGEICCGWNKLKNLKGIKNKTLQDLNAKDNQLETLEGSPEKIYNEVYSSFDVSKNKLSSLEYGPKFVKGSYDCSSNHLVSLDGMAKEIKGNLNCSMNRLKDISVLENSKIDGNINLKNNPEL